MYNRKCILNCRIFYCNICTNYSGGTWYTTYTHVPFYMTNYHRGLLLESPQYSVFDLTQKMSVRLEINNRFLQARIIAG